MSDDQIYLIEFVGGRIPRVARIDKDTEHGRKRCRSKGESELYEWALAVRPEGALEKNYRPRSWELEGLELIDTSRVFIRRRWRSRYE